MANFALYGPGDRLVGIKTRLNGKDAFLPVSVQVSVDAAEAIIQSLGLTAPLGYQQLSADALGTVRTLNVPDGATRAHVQSNGGTAIRWRADATAPSALTGMLLEAGEEQEFYAPLSALRFIGAGTNSVLDVTYYG